MATGFRPKYERTIELAGYSSEELMLLAIEASKSLGWQAGSIKRDKSDFYTPTSFRSWQEKVILSAIDGKDGQLLATSICTEGVSKCTPSFFYAQSPDFHKLGLCYYLKILYL